MTKMKTVSFLFVFLFTFLKSMTILQAFPMYYAKDLQENTMVSKETLDPTEIQNAMCNVVTDQIKATANATITRQLKGVCHAKEVREQLRHIESVLMREIHKVHRAVQGIAAQNSRKPVVFKYLPNRP